MDISFTNPIIFSTLLNKLLNPEAGAGIAIDVPILNKVMGKKKLEGANLKRIVDGRAFFTWKDRELSVSGESIEDMSATV